MYKLCNNVQLTTAQKSELGVDLGSEFVSAIGHDDSVLVSDCLVKLYGLLHLAVDYCKKYHVELVADKTKLLAFAPASQATHLDILKVTNPLSLYGHDLEFSTSAEHVGIIRSVEGNMPNIVNRLSSHRKAIMAVLPLGLAHRHRGNPVTALHIDLLYVSPVQSCPFLTTQELSVLLQHHKTQLKRLQRWITKTH